MQYFGGKQRIAAKLAAFIQPQVTARGAYVEPFVGGAAMMSAIHAPVRIGNDLNESLICMWNAISGGWLPPEYISENEYKRLSAIRDPNDPLTAFAGFGVSFAGKWFGGYARGHVNRNYAANAASSLRKKAKTLSGVTWRAGDYRSCPLPRDCVIYCDPPYAGTTQYGAVSPFNWSDFWEWCERKRAEGFAVFISEYAAPPNFREVLRIETKTDIRTKTSGKESRIERLFTPA